MYQALYRKYRPRSFDDVIGQQHVTDTLKRQVSDGKTSHAYLFVGTRGTGKTTCAKILSRALNCEHPVNGNPCNECASCRGIEEGSIMDVEEIDAASNNGVDNIRDLRSEAIFSPVSTRKRVYIVDEVHMLSNSAFNALLKILEEPPEHLVFILATTEVNKVPATILSRCQRFTFRRIMPDSVKARLAHVAGEEGFSITDGASDLLARLADGSMRDALSLLDQCVTGGTVTEDSVLTAIGAAGQSETAELLSHIVRGDISAALETFSKFYLDGKDASLVLNDITSLCRDMMLSKVAPKGSTYLRSGRFSPEELAQMGRGIGVRRLLSMISCLQETVSGMRSVSDKRTAVEVCIVRLCGTELLPEEENVPVPAAKPVARREEKAVPAPAAESESHPAPPAINEPAELAETAVPAPEPIVVPEPIPEINETHPAEAAPAPVSGGSWRDILDAASAALGPMVHILSNPALNCEITENALCLSSSDTFTLQMAEKQETKQALAEAAFKVLGRHVTVTFRTDAAASAGAENKLSELMKFGNVKFE